MVEEEVRADGRRERSQASRHRVARALLDLIRATGEMPTADAIAEHAGVSRRMVFRHFEDLEGLRHEAMQMQRAEVLERFPPPLAARSLSAGIDALVEHRARVYEHIMPIRRLAERMKHLPHAGDAEAESRAGLRQHLEILLGQHLPRRGKAREELLRALCLVTSWNAWAVLRDDEGLDVPAARAVVRRTVRALLEDDGRRGNDR